MTRETNLVPVEPPQMSEQEARGCVDRIRAGMEDIQKHVYELYERRGWTALGYTTWRECVAAEFAQGERQLYRLAETERVRRVLTHGSTNDVEINERQARELAALAKSDPDAARTVWQLVTKRYGDAVTAEKVRQAVAKRSPKPPKRGPAHTSDRYTCDVCGETSFVPIWHCDVCDEHNPASDRRCPVCDPDVDSLFASNDCAQLAGLREARDALIKTRDTSGQSNREARAFNQIIKRINDLAWQVGAQRDPRRPDSGPAHDDRR